MAFSKISNSIVSVMRIVPLSLKTRKRFPGGHMLPRALLRFPPRWPATTGPAARTGVTRQPAQHRRASCFARPGKSVRGNAPHLQQQPYSQTSGSVPSASALPEQPWVLCVSVRLESGHVKALAISKGITLN